MDSVRSHLRCVALSLFSAVYFLLWVLYGCGHWTGALSGRDYSLLWNTNDCLLSRICFLHLHSTYPLLSLSLSPLPHPFLSLFLFHSFCHPMLNSLSILPSKPTILSLLPHISAPSRCQAPHNLTQSNTVANIHHTNFGPESCSSLSVELALSFTHSLTHPVAFFNGGFCLFHLLENKGFL